MTDLELVRQKSGAFRLSQRRRARLARFYEKVRVSATGCWEWTGVHMDEGYGHFSIKCQTVMAHRFAYEALIGPIPKGLHIDHLCRNRGCVNPWHLDPCTVKENVFRSPIAFGALNARKTHCAQGHPYDDRNTYVDPRGWRKCLSCGRKAAQAKRDALRAQVVG